jgi:hypothetical protein
MKKTTLFTAFVTLGLLISTVTLKADYSYGDTCCECCPNNSVVLCCPQYTFGAEFTALYMQPTASNIHYVAIAHSVPIPAEPISALSPTWEIRDLRPDYQFGFNVGLGLMCHDRSSIAKLNYTHFNSTTHSGLLSVGTGFMLGPFFAVGPDSSAFTEAKGHVKFQFDAFNLDYGLCIEFGDYLRTNFFAGIGGMRIQENLKSLYANSDGNVTRQIKVPTKFEGLGPQVGIDFAYDFWSGFKFTGSGLATLFVGGLSNHTLYRSTSPELIILGAPPVNNQFTTVKNRTGVVPGFEAKLGLGYSFEMCNFAIDIDAGYEVLLYLNALQSIDIGSEVVTRPLSTETSGVYARTFQRTLSNFALSGPYLRIAVAF